MRWVQAHASEGMCTHLRSSTRCNAAYGRARRPRRGLPDRETCTSNIAPLTFRRLTTMEPRCSYDQRTLIDACGSHSPHSAQDYGKQLINCDTSNNSMHPVMHPTASSGVGAQRPSTLDACMCSNDCNHSRAVHTAHILLKTTANNLLNVKCA